MGAVALIGIVAVRCRHYSRHTYRHSRPYFIAIPRPHYIVIPRSYHTAIPGPHLIVIPAKAGIYSWNC